MTERLDDQGRSDKVDVSPTPRTDAELIYLNDGHRANIFVNATFARQLERELSTARSAGTRLSPLGCPIQDCVVVCSFPDDCSRPIQSASERLPEGWMLVPKQWTSEMAHAGFLQADKMNEIACAECGVIYMAMIAAAPVPPVLPDPSDRATHNPSDSRANK